VFRWLVFTTALFASFLLCAQSGKYRLGRAATPEEIRARDISVSPTGAGLPPGHGTAKDGRAIYALRCAACHGEKGEGVGSNPPVAGGRGSLKSNKPVITVGSYWPYATTVWDYINRAMPPENPGSLSAHEVYSTTAFILYLNGIVKDDEEINAKSLVRVKMPNREGFIPDPRPDTKQTIPEASRPN
jgi:S-disulfanyl-L-cysteine oxidoreductase SoxD